MTKIWNLGCKKRNILDVEVNERLSFKIMFIGFAGYF